jgi:hypothetical protein
MITIQEAARLIREAYQEGFGDGADHNNLSYKYPPINIAWMESQSRQILHPGEPQRPRTERAPWYRNGEVTDIELPKDEQ